jgi:hypothetical protein
MKNSTREWISRAEEDYAASVTPARPRKRPLWAPVCFHAQQWVEKYLRARLNEASLLFPERMTWSSCSIKLWRSNRCGPPFAQRSSA